MQNGHRRDGESVESGPTECWAKTKQGGRQSAPEGGGQCALESGHTLCTVKTEQTHCASSTGSAQTHCTNSAPALRQGPGPPVHDPPSHLAASGVAQGPAQPAPTVAWDGSRPLCAILGSAHSAPSVLCHLPGLGPSYSGPYNGRSFPPVKAPPGLGPSYNGPSCYGTACNQLSHPHGHSCNNACHHSNDDKSIKHSQPAHGGGGQPSETIQQPPAWIQPVEETKPSELLMDQGDVRDQPTCNKLTEGTVLRPIEGTNLSELTVSSELTMTTAIKPSELTVTTMANPSELTVPWELSATQPCSGVVAGDRLDWDGDVLMQDSASDLAPLGCLPCPPHVLLEHSAAGHASLAHSSTAAREGTGVAVGGGDSGGPAFALLTDSSAMEGGYGGLSGGGVGGPAFAPGGPGGPFAPLTDSSAMAGGYYYSSPPHAPADGRSGGGCQWAGDYASALASDSKSKSLHLPAAAGEGFAWGGDGADGDAAGPGGPGALEPAVADWFEPGHAWEHFLLPPESGPGILGTCTRPCLPVFSLLAYSASSVRNLWFLFLSVFHASVLHSSMLSFVSFV